MTATPSMTDPVAPPHVPESTPSLVDLNAMTVNLIRSNPDQSQILQNLQSLSQQSTPESDEITISQIAAVLRRNPGLTLTLSYGRCK